MNQSIDKNRLFIAACLALVVTSLSFGIRAGLIEPLAAQFDLSKTEMGWITAMAFFGFPIAMMIGGPLCDVVGMGRLLLIAFISHLAGILLTIFAGGFWTLFISTFFIGFGNGMVEAACNPLVTALYTDNRTTMLNRFHVWFPGGIVIGGLITYFFAQAGLNWQIQVGVMLLPLALYGFLFFGQSFPKTERVASGVSNARMGKALVSPLYLFMIFCMLLTATTELGVGQWLGPLLKSTGVNGILILVLGTGLMAVGRFFAGPLVHRFNPTGMLLGSAVLACAGLFWLGNASVDTVIPAAMVFYLGVCYFWPTMLGFTAEYIPDSGALGLSLMGGAGMFAVSIFNPVLGYFLDEKTSGPQALRFMAILPLILIAAFAGLYVLMRNKKPAPHTDLQKA
jgi:MFS transporter, putative metabolite:H+ symporter